MRKKLLFYFFTITFSAGAQTSVYHPFPDSNAVWNVESLMWWGCGPPTYLTKYEQFTYILSGDTVLNSQQYHKVFVPFVQESCTGSNISHYQYAGYKGSLREDTAARKVYFVYPNDSIDSLLYDFTLQVGDTIRGIVGSVCFLWSGTPVVIDSIDSVFVGGNYRKQWNYGGWMTPGKIIEGIGSLNGLLEGVCPNIADAPEVNLICFKEDNILLYASPSFPSSSCDIIDGIKTVADYVPLEIFPDPVQSELKIQNTEIKIEGIEIYSPLGESVFSQKLKANSQQQQQISIDVSSFNSGMYFARIKAEKGIITRKFIKQ